MKTSLAVFISLLAAVLSFAQPRPDALWEHTFGDLGNDAAYCIRPTLDGNYIIAGTTQSFGEDDIYLIKLHPQGDTLWTRVLDFNNVEQANAVWPTPDGGFLIAGSIYYMDMGNQALLLVKTNQFGDTLWTRAYSSGWTNYASVIKPTPDGGYIVAGAAATPVGDNDVFLLKINAVGDTSWTRTFGTNRNDETYDMTCAADGGYVIAGNSWMQNTSASSYVVKTDALGHPQWTRNYGVYVIVVTFVQQSADGGYMLAGSGVLAGTQHLGGFLMRTDSVGTTQWTQMRAVSSWDEIIFAAQRTSDGGYILAGSIGNLDSALIGMQIVRMDSIGTTLWDRVYRAGTQAVVRSVFENSDHSYLLCGYEDTETNGIDFSIVRTGAENTTLIYPQGGAAVAIGLPLDIRWNGSVQGGNIALELNRNYPSPSWETITASVSNSGHFSWVVTGAESQHARLRIRHLTNPSLSDTTNADFSLRIPRVRLIWPNGGETVLSGVRDTVKFERIVLPGTLRLSINRNYPIGAWEQLSSNLDGDSAALWIVQLPAENHCRLRITSEADSNIYDLSDADFTIRAPQMSLTTPTADEQVTIGSAYSVLWSAAEHNGNFRLMLNRNYPSGTWENVSLNVRNTGRYAWTPSAPASEHCRLRLATLLDPQSYVESAADFSLMASSAEDSRRFIPTEYALHHPYPNPFNTQTNLVFDLPQESFLKLTVYDIAGREVSILAAGNYPAGRHNLLFSADNLPSGIYLVKMNAGKFSALQKMVLLK